MFTCNPFRINTYKKTPKSTDFMRLRANVNSFRIRVCKIQGEGLRVVVGTDRAHP